MITTSLDDGVYDVQVSATSQDDITGFDETTDELEIDLAGPTVEIVEVTPKYRGEAVEQITIEFAESVSGFDLADVTLTRSTDTIVDLLPGAATLTSSDHVTWFLGNMSSLINSSGVYELTLSADGSGIQDEAGNTLTTGALGTWTNRPGDTNEDGRFDQLDLIRVLQEAKYQTGEPATWSQGDWSGNDVFDQHDIIIALQGGQYLVNPNAAFRLGADALFETFPKASADLAETIVDSVFEDLADEEAQI